MSGPDDPRVAAMADLEAAFEDHRRRDARELDLARRIQLALMPPVPDDLDGWELATAYRPARVVGGDFYDLFMLPRRRGRLGLTIADVTGKGVTAALMMAFCRPVMRAAAYNGSGPSDTLERTNRILVEEVRTGLLLTAWTAIVDLRSGTLTHAGGGHEPPLFVRAGATRVSELRLDGPLLGVFGDLGLRRRRVGLRPGDLVVAYTDGVTDAVDAAGRRFGLARFRRIVARTAPAGAAALVAATLDELETWTGGRPPADDITLLAIRRAPEA